MGYTNFPNGVTSMGVPVINGVPLGLTKILFVDYENGSDGVAEKDNSPSKPFKTIAKAMGLITTNKNEGIALMGSATHVLTEMLSVSKSRVHMFGYDPGGRKCGQNAKISLGVTTAVTDIATMQNTGVRNSFRNIKFINENTLTEGIYCVVEAGEYAVYDFCEIYKSTHLTITGAAELVMNGDSATINNCVIGSNANAIVGAIVRPCVKLAKGIVAGAVSRDVTFVGCEFWRWIGNTANAFVWSTSATDVERKMEFRDCLFNVTKNSTAAPAVAVGGTNALTVGSILLTGNTVECGCTALATQTGVFSCMPTYAADGGSSIQAT